MTGPASNDGEQRLLGGWQTEVHVIDDIVHRSPGPQSAAVIALLRHLEEVGFAAAPRVAGTGLSTDGRETLEFIDGQSPQPRPWNDDAIPKLGQLLRQLHTATASFSPPEPAHWQPWFARDLPGDEPVIGHGDLRPWNILARNDRPIAFIDWDNAGPVDASWELAQVA